LKPLISIIIPTFNRAHLLGETLDSVLAQSYSKWECIVIDDGSTDNTKEVLELYCKKDKRFQYHNRPEDRHKGANSCRNYGLELSKGEFVNWFDSDDIMLPNKLETHIDKLSNNRSIDATVSVSYLYNFKTDKALWPWRVKLTSENLLEDFILLKVGWSICDPIWQRKSLNDLKFNESLQSYQDWEFHVKAIIFSKNFLFIDDCLTHIRFTPGSIQNTEGIEKYWVNYLAHKSTINLLLKNNLLTDTVGEILLDKCYTFFSIFSFNKKIKYSLSVIKSI